VWGSVTELPGSLGGSGRFNAVSCASAGNCTAVGFDGNSQKIYATDTEGVWGPPTELPGPHGGGGAFYGVSCTSIGSCTAVGQNQKNFIYATETHGVWGTVTTLPRPEDFSGRLSAVSCTDAGDCTAVGAMEDLHVPYRNGGPAYANESGGVWSPVTNLQVTPNPIAFFYGVSCTGSGTCTAVGTSTKDVPMASSSKVASPAVKSLAAT
jgi:hypothetical protein